MPVIGGRLETDIGLPLQAPDDDPAADINAVAASVIIATEIPPDNFDVNFVLDDDPKDSFWTDFRCRNRYEKDGHLYMMGLSSPLGLQGQTCAFVQLTAPTLLWVADWTAARVGLPPRVPSPSVLLKNPNWVLLDEHYEPTALTLVADGTLPLYRLSGTYVYGHKKPDANTVLNLSFARPPWVDESLDRGLSTGLLTPDLITGGEKVK